MRENRNYLTIPMDCIPGLPDDVGRHILGFLDVPTLVKKKVIRRSWCTLFTNTIEKKAPIPKPFESRDELRRCPKYR
eukprot:scaffold638035_cov134-Attheya_sp.AAC.1